MQHAQGGESPGADAIGLVLLKSGVVETFGELDLGKERGDVLIGLLALHLMRCRVDKLG